MRNPTNQVEFLISETFKQLKEIQNLKSEMQRLKIKNPEQQQSLSQSNSINQMIQQLPEISLKSEVESSQIEEVKVESRFNNDQL